MKEINVFNLEFGDLGRETTEVRFHPKTGFLLASRLFEIGVRDAVDICNRVEALEVGSGTVFGITLVYDDSIRLGNVIVK